MAATEPQRILAASLLLPGLAALSGAVRAEEPPAQGVVAFKLGHYRDWQPGFERIRVSSPQVYVLAPIAGQWSLEGSHVIDSVSGATPRLETFRTGASRMADRRRATDVKVTRYFHRAAVAVGAAYSGENDYVSRAGSVELRLASEDNNRTYIAGFGHADDRIDTSTTRGNATDRHRRTDELQLGVTQVLTPDDTGQLLYTRSQGRGYFNDPYKDFEARPDRRNADILLARWNHYVERFDAAVRANWRYYRDSFGIRSHALGVEWAQPWRAWTFTPGLRWQTQTAASFYFEPVANAQGIPSDLLTRIHAIGLAGNHSGDYRLAPFDAVTASLKVAYAFTPDDVVDVKVDAYRQSPRGAIEPIRARVLQAGYTHRF